MTSTSGASAAASEDQTDAELVARVVGRDQRALEVIFNRHVPIVLGIAGRVLNDTGMAEEVAQEVLLRLWNEPDRFDVSRGSLRSFLVRQAHSRAVERVRSEEARRRREDRFDRESAVEPESPDLLVLSSVRDASLRAALAQLSDGERAAIGLAYFGGHSYRAVAVRLGVPEGTVKGRIRSGLGKLAAALEIEGMEESS